MTRPNSFLLMILGTLIGSVGTTLAATPGSTPYSHTQCAALGLTDSACHRQIIESGGIPQPVTSSTQTIVPTDFNGLNEKERWYRKYVEYVRRAAFKPKPMQQAIDDHYPDIPVPTPHFYVLP